MEFWLLVLIDVLALVCLGLLWHIVWMRRSLREITAELEEKLGADTNTLLSVSSSDAAVRVLAANLNVQLRTLRRERRRSKMVLTASKIIIILAAVLIGVVIGGGGLA